MKRKFDINPNHISGIHNYCDKWCERCAFTARCAVFAMEQKEKASGYGANDVTNKEFWEHLQKLMTDMLNDVREMAERAGVDINKLMTAEEEAERSHVETQISSHPLILAATRYRKEVSVWFESSQGRFDEKAAQLTSVASMELPGAEPEKEAREIHDLAGVVLWYHTLIGVKIHRALHGKFEGIPACIEDMPKDRDGSAKIALISIERSMGAWLRMRELFPTEEDVILDYLVQLEFLLRGLEREFPAARAFIRPGFDE